MWDFSEFVKSNKMIRHVLPAILAICLLFGFSVYFYGTQPMSTFSLFVLIVVASTIASYVSLYPTQIAIGLVRSTSIALFAVSFAGAAVAILSPDLLPYPDEQQNREAQIILAVCSAGMMGGLMRQIALKNQMQGPSEAVWEVCLAAAKGVFVSFVLFLILRAGIINQTEIDTFNVWGVTGVSAITGFFSEKMIGRFSHLFDQVVGAGGGPGS